MRRSTLFLLAAGLAAGILGAGRAQAEEPATYQAALDAARTAEKPVLIDFFADW